MSNVVKFSKPPEPPEPPDTPDRELAWCCACGCSSFFLLADGSTQCCGCDVIDPEGWTVDLSKVIEILPGVALKVTVNHHVEDFNLESMLHDARAKRDDLSAMLTIYRDGAVSTWCTAADFETVAQEDWLRRRALAGVNVILDKALDDMGIRGMRFPTRPKPRKKPLAAPHNSKRGQR